MATRKSIVYRILVAAAFSLPGISIPPRCQIIQEMEFRNQPVSDILLMIARATGTSIIPDETVTGTATYYFSRSDLEPALEAFLDSAGYYLRRDGDIFRVSKVKILYDPASETVDIDAEDVPPQYILRRLARETRNTILFDSLPADPISFHGDGFTVERALRMIAGKYPEIGLEQKEECYYLRAAAGTGETERVVRLDTMRKCDVELLEGEYRITCKGERLGTVLDMLFGKTEEHFLLLGGSNPPLEQLDIRTGTFREALGMVLDAVSFGSSQYGGIHYIYPGSSSDVLNRLYTTMRIPLRHIDAETLAELLPPRLYSPDGLTFDRYGQGNGAAVVFGSPAEIEALARFIETVDVPDRHAGYRKYTLSFAGAAEVAKIIPKDRFDAEVVPLPETNTLMVAVPEPRRKSFEDFLAAVDTPSESTPIRLKYIDTDTLMEKLPPSIAPEYLTPSTDPSLLFYTGPAERRRLFLEELSLLDVPVPQIQYQLLVLQFQDGKDLHREIEIGNSILERGSRSAFLGTIGNLLSLNFDIVSYFGYLFALRLHLTIGESRARILADTTLCGLSAHKVTFKNTDTYRYRDMEMNESTGTYENTGITREITTGLIIAITGEVSGDGMVTMDVEATISKRGADNGSSQSILPDTSEKILNTRVRSPEGEPVIIGGLVQQEASSDIDKVPGLGDIPVLKYLFSSERRASENTELVICLVPRVTGEPAKEEEESIMRRVYRRFVEDASPLPAAHPGEMVE